MGESLGLDKTLNSRGKTPQDTLTAILYVNVRDKVDSPFILASRRPATFWLKARKNELQNALSKSIAQDINLNPSKQKSRFHERDLQKIILMYIPKQSITKRAKKDVVGKISGITPIL